MIDINNQKHVDALDSLCFIVCKGYHRSENDFTSFYDLHLNSAQKDCFRRDYICSLKKTIWVTVYNVLQTLKYMPSESDSEHYYLVKDLIDKHFDEPNHFSKL